MVVRSPRPSTRASVRGARVAQAVTKRLAGDSSGLAHTRARPAGYNVPQWMGTTTRAPIVSARRAAPRGPRCHGAECGPQLPIGSRATSTRPASAPSSANADVSPAK